jgi:Tol biopolymer transport system component
MTLGIGTTGRRIWVMDLDRGVPVQLSDRDGGAAIYEEFESIWSLDGERVYFTSMRSGEMRIWTHAADGSGVDQMLVDDPNVLVPLEAIPDGRLFVMRTQAGALDIGVLDPADPGTVDWLTESPFNEAMPTVSPDGRWLAFASDELGDRFEIYVQPLLSDGPRLRVSVNGGVFPVWDPSDNGNIYYIGRDDAGEPAMLAARLEFSPEPRVVDEQTLFYRDDFSAWVDGGMLRPFDISPTDGRFLIPILDQSQGSDEMTVWVMLNWPARLQ